MDVILVGRRRDHTWRLNFHVRHWQLGLLVGVFALLTATAGWYGGNWLNARDAGEPLDIAGLWASELEEQRRDLQSTREDLEANTHALARRLALLNAQMIRLDAAGKRLTEIAKLDAGEFDFDAEPAVGGPEADAEDIVADISMDSIHAALDAYEQRLADRGRQMRVLEDLLLASRLEKEVRPSGWPLDGGWISSRFGLRTDPFTGRRARHNGMDFAGRDGSDVLAVASGVVSHAGYRYGYGKLVEINHGNGYATRYAHNKLVRVEVGDRVDKGQVIAAMGSTGRSTGPHVHFEVLLNGRMVDPADYIQAAR